MKRNRNDRRPSVNAPCPCASGIKYKKCCGAPTGVAATAASGRAGGSYRPAQNIQPGVAPWTENPESPCPCGSGKPYLECCQSVLAAHEHQALIELARGAYNGRDFTRALTFYRAYFTHYLRWVYEHTLPFQAAQLPMSETMVGIDREVLSELTETVAHCLYALDRAPEIPGFLTHVETVVPLAGLRKDIAYIRAAWLYTAFDDRDGAVTELAKVGDILSFPRREAWELYLDIHGGTLSERNKIKIADCIVAEAGRDEHVRVQYTAIKAIALLQIGELGEARRALGAVLNVRTPPSIETTNQISTQWQTAKAWSLYGELFDDPEALRTAEHMLLRIPDTSLKPAGNAALQRDLGWLLRDQMRYCDAAEAFRKSLRFEGSQVSQIHLVHALALCGNIDDARTELEKLPDGMIDHSLRLEYFAAGGSFAVAANDMAIGLRMVDGLRTFTMESPFWEAQRNQLLVQLLDFVHRPDALPALERQGKILKRLLSLNDVFELKPHIFGIGLNINKIIEKLAKRQL